MASVNKTKEKPEVTTTHGGAKTIKLKPIDELRRTVLSSLLFENQHYEDGEDTVQRINRLIPLVNTTDLLKLTIDAREKMHLRHVPLYLTIQMLKDKEHKQFVRRLIQKVIYTTSQATELLAMYWKENNRKDNKSKKKIASQLKKGLADRLLTFDEYQLAKSKKDKEITIKDLVRLCHPKGTDLLKRFLNNELAPPDTWEVLISRSGKDKTKRISAWNRLIDEKLFPEEAFLKNLRNMQDDGVDINKIKKHFTNIKFRRTLPYQFMAAANNVPTFKKDIESAMLTSFNNIKLNGNTLIIIDMSGSMSSHMSGKSKLTRLDGSLILTMILNQICENPTFYATAGDDYSVKHATCKVTPNKGFELANSFKHINTIGHSGIFLTQVMDYIDKNESKLFDRVIVITDEQDCEKDKNKAPSLAKVLGSQNNYIINVGAYETGFGLEYKQKWTHINGFSNYVCRYIYEYENFINTLE